MWDSAGGKFIRTRNSTTTKKVLAVVSVRLPNVSPVCIDGSGSFINYSATVSILRGVIFSHCNNQIKQRSLLLVRAIKNFHAKKLDAKSRVPQTDMFEKEPKRTQDRRICENHRAIKQARVAKLNFSTVM